jgi:hypothetical protein
VSVREVEADLVVARRDEVADGVVALTLADGDGCVLPGWTPGAHVDLVLRDGLTRQYSLCGSPADSDAWRIGVLRDPASRGGSLVVHEQLHEGTAVRVRGPRNHFPLVSSPRLVQLWRSARVRPCPVLTVVESWEWHEPEIGHAASGPLSTSGRLIGPSSARPSTWRQRSIAHASTAACRRAVCAHVGRHPRSTSRD